MSKFSLTSISRRISKVKSRGVEQRKTWVSPFFRNLTPALVLIVLCIVLFFLAKEFLSFYNLLTLMVQVSIILVLGLGLTFVILMGGIDLSVGAIVSCSSVFVAILLPRLGYLAFIVAILGGTSIGLLNGLVHSKWKVPSFIVTLGSFNIGVGLAYFVSGLKPIPIRKEYIGHMWWLKEVTLGIPNITIVAVIIFFLLFFLERFTRFGRYVRAIGDNERIADLLGVPIVRCKTLAFVLNGTLAGVAGVLLAARLLSGSPRVGDVYLLDSIAVVVVGGTALSGGIGGVTRTLIGALLITVVRNGMNVVGVNIFTQQIVLGLIFILGVALTIDRTKFPIIK